MNWTTFKRVTKLGFTNFYRNGWLSFATCLVMGVTLFIISAFVIFNILISFTTQNLKSKIDISVYFYDNTTEQQISVIKGQLSKRPDVSSVKYVSKEDALAIWNSRKMDDRIKSLVTSDNNPLPRSLEVKATDPEHLGSVAQFLTKEDYKDLIRKVDYQENKDIIEKLNNVIRFSKKIGIILSSLFVVISILVILNTIRLTIVTRKDEIEIMRLVGANNAFIRVPFFIEGVLYGIFASILSILIIYIGMKFLTPSINNYLGGLDINFSNFFTENLLVIIVLQLTVSILISVICSFISIQKYLKI